MFTRTEIIKEVRMSTIAVECRGAKIGKIPLVMIERNEKREEVEDSRLIYSTG